MPQFGIVQSERDYSLTKKNHLGEILVIRRCPIHVSQIYIYICINTQYIERERYFKIISDIHSSVFSKLSLSS